MHAQGLIFADVPALKASDASMMYMHAAGDHRSVVLPCVSMLFAVPRTVLTKLPLHQRLVFINQLLRGTVSRLEVV